MSGAAELLQTMEATGVRVTLNATGDGLIVKANSRPPADLLAQIRDAKPLLLEALRDVAARRLPTVDTVTRTCGCCARWAALAPPLIHMGLCSVGRRAHGWRDGNPVTPVEIQAAHRCVAHDGKAYQPTFRAGQHPLLPTLLNSTESE